MHIMSESRKSRCHFMQFCRRVRDVNMMTVNRYVSCRELQLINIVVSDFVVCHH